MSFWQSINNRKNSSYIVIGVAALFVAILLYTNLSRNPGVYESKLAKAREARDLFLKNSPESPIPRDQKLDFGGLDYFPANGAFISAAELNRDPSPDTIRMLLSNGQFERMVKVGTLEFFLKKRPQSLTAFRPVDAGAGTDLFVPFTDLTTGTLTYGGGRYLNVPTKGGISLDFNRAYHPDCFYNEGYACPIPPEENHLNLEITAGERIPEEEDPHGA